MEGAIEFSQPSSSSTTNNEYEPPATQPVVPTQLCSTSSQKRSSVSEQPKASKRQKMSKLQEDQDRLKEEISDHHIGKIILLCLLHLGEVKNPPWDGEAVGRQWGGVEVSWGRGGEGSRVFQPGQDRIIKIAYQISGRVQ